MKTIKSYIVAVSTFVLLLSSVSCSKDFYTNANVNPNSPSAVPSSTLLTGVEVSLAYTQGGAASQFTSLFMQQTVGAQRQAQAYYDYILTPADPEYLWDQMYTDVMENDYTLLNQAQAAGQNEYYGIANILMAYSLQVTIDMWGNEPYSAAFKGASNIQPTYDNGSTIYSNILTLLNTGITSLKNSNKGSLYPTADDVMFGGSETEWIAFAEAIEARIYIHQCKHGNASLEQNAIAAVDSAISNGFVNAEVVFGATNSNSNPWYQFNNQRGGYIAFTGSSMLDTMIANTDPRVDIFVDTAAAAQTLGNYYGSSTSPVEFITTEELYFIAAEANLRLGNAVAAQTAYTAALNANMNKLAVAPAAITSYEAGSQGTLPVSQASAGPEIVRRMIYPNTEVTLNSNCPAGVTMFLPQIFWDN